MASAQARDLTYDGHGLRAPCGHRDEPTYSPDQIPAGQIQLLLTADPESVRAARDFTAETLRGWQLDALVDEGVMIASELVTNAVRHGACLGGPGSGKVGLTWQRHIGQVICVVTDGSSMPPVLVPADRGAESGRGLGMDNAGRGREGGLGGPAAAVTVRRPGTSLSWQAGCPDRSPPGRASR